MLCCFCAGAHSTLQMCGGLVQELAQGSAGTSLSLSGGTHQMCPGGARPLAAETPAATPGTLPKPGRGRGRPRKNQPVMDEGSDGEYTPPRASRSPKQPGRGGPRGPRTHCKCSQALSLIRRSPLPNRLLLFMEKCEEHMSPISVQFSAAQSVSPSGCAPLLHFK